ncbi:MAG: hypothetical protein N5P05_002256 [Chroococcopsis gigantea SAG 12.99]|jgi:CRISPR-associated protein Csc1|nr:hypothetical protein [Chroococcopsis gigantea SAG 12.99]
MLNIYRCRVELHDSLYFATREIGRLYETEAILHNYGLCYALGLVTEDSYRYFCSEQIPRYEEHLTPLNERGIYVTPADSITHKSILNTWKYANNNYHTEMEKTQKNFPSFGRNKEIAPESIFECFILSKNTIRLPRWIRLGKWASKAEMTLERIDGGRVREGVFTCHHPLNPLDVMFGNQVMAYDVINMPPVSLIRNVTIRGSYFEKLNLPVNMSYRFS